MQIQYNWKTGDKIDAKSTHSFFTMYFANILRYNMYYRLDGCLNSFIAHYELCTKYKKEGLNTVIDGVYTINDIFTPHETQSIVHEGLQGLSKKVIHDKILEFFKKINKERGLPDFGNVEKLYQVTSEGSQKGSLTYSPVYIKNEQNQDVLLNMSEYLNT